MYRAQPADAPQCRPPAGFCRTLHDRHPGFGEARSAAFDMGGNLVAEVAVRRRAEPGGSIRSYQRPDGPTDARIRTDERTLCRRLVASPRGRNSLLNAGSLDDCRLSTIAAGGECKWVGAPAYPVQRARRSCRAGRVALRWRWTRTLMSGCRRLRGGSSRSSRALAATQVLSQASRGRPCASRQAALRRTRGPRLRVL